MYNALLGLFPSTYNDFSLSITDSGLFNIICFFLSGNFSLELNLHIYISIASTVLQKIYATFIFY